MPNEQHRQWVRGVLREYATTVLREYHRRRQAMGDDCIVVLAAPDHPLAKIIAQTYPRPLGAGDWLPSEAARRRGEWVCSAVPHALAGRSLGGFAGERPDYELNRPLPAGYLRVVVLAVPPDYRGDLYFVWAAVPIALSEEVHSDGPA
jgi:hypothetical protein